MSKEYLRPPRGMRDIVGEEAEIYEYLINEFKRIASLHGFKPVIPPTIEFYKLFEAKSGEEIKKTMYVFQDKAGRVVALRPEVTASIIRIYLRKLRGEPKPVKLYYVTQCFRYEEPQRGRYREFWQLGLENIGDPTINADIEIAYTASHFLEEIGIKHYYIVNNIAIYRIFFDIEGFNHELQEHILHLIDKREIEKALNTIKNNSEKLYNIFKEIFNSKLSSLENIFNENKEYLGTRYREVLKEYENLLLFVEEMRKLGFNIEYDPLLVRGLAYYTGLIYELKFLERDLKISFGGGGRYDGLTEVYGGPYEYSTGIALGLDRIVLVYDKKPVRRSIDAIVFLFSEKYIDYGYNIVRILNDIGISTWIYVSNKIGKALSIANRKKIRYAFIIGDKEYSNKEITVKDLVKGVQETIDYKCLKKYIAEQLLDPSNV